MTVLEARDRVGGRTWTDTIDDAVLEIGGQWVSPDQTALIDLLVELGLEMFDRYRAGESVYMAPDGTRMRCTGEIFPVPETTKREMNRRIGLLDELAAALGIQAPRTHPRARELDTISLHHWLRQQSAHEEACHNIGVFLAGGMLTKPAHAFSALQAVLMAASAGSFSNLVDEDFLLDKRVIGGMQQVSERLSARRANDVILYAPVRALRWEAADGGQRPLRHHGRAAEPVFARLLRASASPPPAPDAPAPVAGSGHQGTRRL